VQVLASSYADVFLITAALSALAALLALTLPGRPKPAPAAAASASDSDSASEPTEPGTAALESATAADAAPVTERVPAASH
jgi:hypothetical protein